MNGRVLALFVLAVSGSPSSLRDELEQGRHCGTDITPLCEFRLDRSVFISFVRGEAGFSIEDGRERPTRTFSYAYEPQGECLSVFETVKGVRRSAVSIAISTAIVHRFAHCSDEPARDVP
jgi:hypothetical protein